MTFNFESLFVALWGLHQVRIGQCEKCGSMGCFASDFPTFLLHVNAATTFSERRLQVVQSLVHTYIFLPPPLHWARLRALGLTWLDLIGWWNCLTNASIGRSVLRTREKCHCSIPDWPVTIDYPDLWYRKVICFCDPGLYWRRGKIVKLLPIYITLAKLQKLRQVWTPKFDINCRDFPWR